MRLPWSSDHFAHIGAVALATVPVLALAAVAGLVASGCGSSTNTRPDAGQGTLPASDAAASSDDGGVAAGDDGGNPTLDATTLDDGGHLSGADASDGQSQVLPPAGHLFALGLSGPGEARVFSFSAGAWNDDILLSSLVVINQSATVLHGGGGMALLANGDTVVTLLDANNSDVMAAAAMSTGTSKTGTWTNLTDEPDAGAGGGANTDLGIPVASSTGAFVAHVPASGAVVVDQLVSGTSWTSAATGLTSDKTSAPVVGITASGDPIVIASNGTSYMWSLRTGGVWGAPAAIAGIATPPPPNGTAIYFPGSSVIQVPSTGALLAGFSTQVPGEDGALAVAIKVATFSGGAWSAPTTLATDIGTYPDEWPRFVALADGTIAMGYQAVLNGSDPIKIGFYDGANWSAFQVAPTVYAAHGWAISRGAAGAVLEAVYADSGGSFFHERLTDRANWVWSSVIPIDASTNSRGYSAVQILAGP
jgi:hypothetical protein